MSENLKYIEYFSTENFEAVLQWYAYYDYTRLLDIEIKKQKAAKKNSILYWGPCRKEATKIF